MFRWDKNTLRSSDAIVALKRHGAAESHSVFIVSLFFLVCLRVDDNLHTAAR